MEDRIVSWIESFVKGYIWRRPLISFCSAEATEKLPKIVKNHLTAEEVLPKAKGVIVYFVPFTRSVVESNVEGKRPSKLWAYAYVKTNELINNLNELLVLNLKRQGFNSIPMKPTHDFDERTLMSRWSHKHLAYISGLGTFGVHTMIITEKGCCGRLGSLITEAEFEWRNPLDYELCNRCLECVERCVGGALSVEGLDKRKCYDILIENARDLADVCGKCACGVPCSLSRPI